MDTASNMNLIHQWGNYNIVYSIVFSLWVFISQVAFKWDVLMFPTDLNHVGIKKLLKNEQKPS